VLPSRRGRDHGLGLAAQEDVGSHQRVPASTSHGWVRSMPTRARALRPTAVRSVPSDQSGRAGGRPRHLATIVAERRRLGDLSPAPSDALARCAPRWV